MGIRFVVPISLLPQTILLGKASSLVQTVLTYDGSAYNFLTLWESENDTRSVETIHWMLNFDTFPGLAACGLILSGCLQDHFSRACSNPVPGPCTCVRISPYLLSRTYCGLTVAPSLSSVLKCRQYFSVISSSIICIPCGRGLEYMERLSDSSLALRQPLSQFMFSFCILGDFLVPHLLGHGSPLSPYTRLPFRLDVVFRS